MRRALPFSVVVFDVMATAAGVNPGKSRRGAVVAANPPVPPQGKVVTYPAPTGETVSTDYHGSYAGPESLTQWWPC